MSILVSVPQYPSCNNHGPQLSKVRLSLDGKVRVLPPRRRSTALVPLKCIKLNNGASGIATLPAKVDKEEAVEEVNGGVLTPTEVPSKPVLPPLPSTTTTTVGRSSFPPGFTFGAATAAYQIEGAWNIDGKGQSIWDTFTHNHPEKITDKSNGDNALESYTRYKEDIKALKDLGLDAYRFSISWPRILPKGSKKGGLNRDGIRYYHNLIDELIENGIVPYVTLFHWDVPQALETDYGGFLDKRIVNDFKDFADLCFKEFGDRVRHWITINEPWSFSAMGYGLGCFAPGRSSIPEMWCTEGNSMTEPYIVGHNLILAHAAAAKLYKEEYQPKQQGKIGMTVSIMWYRPYSDSYQDQEAASRAVQFMLGWYIDPLVYGDYPFIMRALVRERLPVFTPEESEMVKGSYDFIGINYYTSKYAKGKDLGSKSVWSVPGYMDDSCVDEDQTVNAYGIPIATESSAWVYLCPNEFKDLLVYLKHRYNDPEIYITENGTLEEDTSAETLGNKLEDQHRTKYIHHHLDKLREAIELADVKVKGYFAWSLMDNFEWRSGYTERFGLMYIDFNNNLKRIPKASARWFTRFLRA